MALDSETMLRLLESVARSVRERLRSLQRQIAQEGSIRREIDEMGLLGLSIPQGCNGLGLPMEEDVRGAFDFGKTSTAFRSLIGANNCIGSSMTASTTL